MTDTKISLDDAIKHLSTNLNQHADTVRRLQENLDAIQPKLDSQLTSFQSETKQELKTLETTLSNLIASNDVQWSSISTQMHSITEGLRDLQSLFPQHPHPTSRSIPTDSPRPPISNTHNLSDHSHNASATTADLTTPQPPPFFNYPRFDATPPSPPTNHFSTIVLPPVSSPPTFSGKSSERPHQFLIRIEQHAHTVNHWNHATLLRGISQFLKDDALEWYCQLYRSDQLPTTWDEFVRLFLSQFFSPLRAAQQDQAWTDCRQQDNETITQFVVRLRSLWFEQKPEDKESDFIKHLFCKMRPDMLNLMNFSRSSSLQSILAEAEKVEEILYLRNKEQRHRDLTKTKSFPTISSPLAAPSLMSTSTRSSTSTRAPPRSSASQQPSSNRNPVTCWRCYNVGHYSPDCPFNDTKQQDSYPPRSNPVSPDYSYQPLPPRSKND